MTPPDHMEEKCRIALSEAALDELVAIAQEQGMGYEVENHPSPVEKRSPSIAPVEIDPMEPFAEVPRMLPSFPTRNGLRMTYVDSAGKQRCLILNVADLTRIIHSAAIALEAMTREKTMAAE
jgi:hypothetical protein